ncbi:hypothetical protein AB0F77_13580 [Streptomyces sp. NPDC026672]|uniref:hypothetical protein n=1 Tax=unclassified Streptomyces TaxID=2593676 RepID=UPI0033D64EC4
MPTCLAISGTKTTGHCSASPSPERRHRSTVLYEEVMGPVCEQLGLTFLRADKLAEAGLPGEQLLRMVAEVDIVVADVGEPDAELSFGLGVRHALGRYTVHVTEGTAVLTGAATTPRIEFPSRSADVVMARRQLMGLLTEVVCGETAVPLPALSTAPIAQAAAEHDEEAPGLFEVVVDAEAQLEAMEGHMADVESALTDFTAMMDLIGEDMARVSHPGASMSMKLSVVNRLAKAIDGPADDLESAAKSFAEGMGAAAVALRVFLEWAGNTPRSEWPEGADGVLDDVGNATWDVQAAAVGFQEGMALIDMFGASSRRLRRPVRRISTSFRIIFQSVSVLEELQDMAVALKKS